MKRVLAVVVLKPKIKRSGGLEVVVALGQARFDSAVSLRRWSGVEWWSGAMRCGAGTLQYGQMLRCARGREACRGQLGKLEFGRLKAASDARLPWEA